MELTVRILTFNIRLDTEADGLDAWSYRKAAAASVITESGAELVCLQEALFHQYQDLLTSLGESWTGIFAGRDDGHHGGEACAILFKKDILYCTNAPHTFWLSDTPDAPGSKSWGSPLPRIATCAHFLYLPAYRGVHICNVHLDHTRAAIRAKEVDVLLSRLPLKGSADPLIVCGDFNASAGEECVRKMSEPLIDVVAHADDKSLSTHGTFHQFTGSPGGAAERIDYIFASSGVLIDRVDVMDMPVEGRWPSDHFPVAANLRWSA